MTDPLLTYYVEENEPRKMTSLYVKRFEASERGTLVAFWNWRLTGRQSAYIAATKLRDSRQRMADEGKPLAVEAELLTGPRGAIKREKFEELKQQLAERGKE